MFKIGNDIPPPTPRAPKQPATGLPGRPRVVPWNEVKVGGYLFIQCERASQVSSSLNYWKRKNPDQQWISRREDGGVRFWRTA